MQPPRPPAVRASPTKNFGFNGGTHPRCFSCDIYKRIDLRHDKRKKMDAWNSWLESRRPGHKYVEDVTDSSDEGVKTCTKSYVVPDSGVVTHPVHVVIGLPITDVYQGNGEWKMQPVELRHWNDVFLGFSCVGTNIVRCAFSLGDEHIWFLTYPDEPDKIDFTCPCGFEWPLKMSSYHDFYLVIKSAPGSTLTIKDSFRCEVPSDPWFNRATALEFQCSGPNENPWSDFVRASSGMFGTGTLPTDDIERNRKRSDDIRRREKRFRDKERAESCWRHIGTVCSWVFGIGETFGVYFRRCLKIERLKS